MVHRALKALIPLTLLAASALMPACQTYHAPPEARIVGTSDNVLKDPSAPIVLAFTPEVNPRTLKLKIIRYVADPEGNLVGEDAPENVLFRMDGTNEPEGGKVSRAYAAQPEVEAGNVFLPHPALYGWVDQFVGSCAAFPNAANDDDVDAFTQAIIRWQAGGGVVAAEPVVSSAAQVEEMFGYWLQFLTASRPSGSGAASRSGRLLSAACPRRPLRSRPTSPSRRRATGAA